VNQIRPEDVKRESRSRQFGIDLVIKECDAIETNACSNIMFLDIIHRPVYITKHNVSETGFCLRLQIKLTQLGPINRASPHLWYWYRCSSLKVKLCLLPVSCWFLAWLIPRPWWWRRNVILQCPLICNVLRRFLSQKIELFITTAVKTSNPT
jgi:hypothetical protein